MTFGTPGLPHLLRIRETARVRPRDRDPDRYLVVLHPRRAAWLQGGLDGEPVLPDSIVFSFSV